MTTVLIDEGDILESQAKALVVPTNCIGPMEKGLARAFARRFIGLERAYREACNQGHVRAGLVWPIPMSGKVIMCLPTKRHWRDASLLKDVVAGVADLRLELLCRGIESVAIPALGCGLGGLPWESVKTIIESRFSNNHIHAEIYSPKQEQPQ